MATAFNQTNGGETSSTQHVVQFYESDSFLINSVSEFVESGFRMGDSCIIVATTSHREELEKLLQKKGVDLFFARVRGDYLALDPIETMTEFMVNGMPEAGRFNEVIEDAISRVFKSPRHLRIFGEIVALLWNDGNRAAAIRLEELWNELFKRLPVYSLFCAYPISSFKGESYEEQFTQVCRQHSLVIPDESSTAISDLDDHLHAITLFNTWKQERE